MEQMETIKIVHINCKPVKTIGLNDQNSSLIDQSYLKEDLCYDMMESEHLWLQESNEALPLMRFNLKAASATKT